ncbi:MAG TPA: response regulator transcription factor [Solirubrobacterales bacterium]|nr:response regulator transcription factor [Solirubrobacterales bacterium]
MGSERPHCLVIDGHPLVRAGVRQTLSDDFEVHETERREEAVELIRDVGSIDVAIVDMRRAPAGAVETLRGIEAIQLLRQAAPGLGIVAHGERAERYMVTAALQAGASAYLSRTAAAEALLDAVRAALAHERFIDPAIPARGSRGKLTRRQRQILQLLADGHSTVFAARELDVSEETVKTHLKKALSRLEAKNRTHAVSIALRESLIE